MPEKMIAAESSPGFRVDRNPVLEIIPDRAVIYRRFRPLFPDPDPGTSIPPKGAVLKNPAGSILNQKPAVLIILESAVFYRRFCSFSLDLKSCARIFKSLALREFSFRPLPHKKSGISAFFRGTVNDDRIRLVLKYSKTDPRMRHKSARVKFTHGCRNENSTSAEKIIYANVPERQISNFRETAFKTQNIPPASLQDDTVPVASFSNDFDVFAHHERLLDLMDSVQDKQRTARGGLIVCLLKR